MRTPPRANLFLAMLLLFAGTLSRSSAQDVPAKQDKVESKEVLPAHLQLTAYELQTTPEQAAKLNAKSLTSSAATPESLLGALEAAGKARILYRIDQPVNVASERVQISNKEPVITGTRMTANGGQVNTVSVQNVGIIAELSSAKAAEGAKPNVIMEVEMSAITPSDKELARGIKMVNTRTIAFKHSEALEYDRPAAMLSVNSASEQDAASPMVYVIRYVFSAPAAK